MADRTGKTVSNHSHQMYEIAFQLAPEIISDILSWLPIKDILKCRSVCKDWYALTKEPHFINLQQSRSSSLRPRVILIPDSQYSLFLLDTRQNKVRKISLDIMARWSLVIMGSCNGFLCLASDISPNPVVVCNPVTQQHVVLPESVAEFLFFDHDVGLGYDPWTKKYKVVKVYHNDEINKFQIIAVGESSWRQLGAPYRVRSGGNEGPIYCDGVLYWIIDKEFHSAGNEYILALDLKDEKFRAITFPPNIRMPRYYTDWHDGNLQLLNLAGCITLIEDERRLMHTWRMTKKRDGSFLFNHYACDMYVRWNVFSLPVLVDVMSQDCWLLEVSKFGMHWERDLVLYYPKKKQYSSLQINGLPPWFRSSSLKPNLVSPAAASLLDES